MAADKTLISTAAVVVDATFREANAAMKRFVRRDSEHWKENIKRLMLEKSEIAADDDPTDEEPRRIDKRRKGKKDSNKDWKSPTDNDARIVKMKDGRTHMGDKAQHVVDLETEVVLSADVCHGTAPDRQPLCESVVHAQTHLQDASPEDAMMKWWPTRATTVVHNWLSAMRFAFAGTLRNRHQNTNVLDGQRGGCRRLCDPPPLA